MASTRPAAGSSGEAGSTALLAGAQIHDQSARAAAAARIALGPGDQRLLRARQGAGQREPRERGALAGRPWTPRRGQLVDQVGIEHAVRARALPVERGRSGATHDQQIPVQAGNRGGRSDAQRSGATGTLARSRRRPTRPRILRRIQRSGRRSSARFSNSAAFTTRSSARSMARPARAFWPSAASGAWSSSSA